MSFIDPDWIRLWQNLRNSDPFTASPLRKVPYPAVALSIAIVHLGLLPAGNLVLARSPQALPGFPGFGLDLVIVLVFGPRYWPILLAAIEAKRDRPRKPRGLEIIDEATGLPKYRNRVGRRRGVEYPADVEAGDRHGEREI